MKIYTYQNLTNTEKEALCTRGDTLSEKVVQIAHDIGKQVKKDGDAALFTLTEKLDKAQLQTLRVSEDEINAADTKVSSALKEAIKTAHDNIKKVHTAQFSGDKTEDKIESTTGVFCWKKFQAIDTVGLYIPGGTAPLFSTILMLGVPALIAGCKRIILCSPPNSAGEIAPEMLWTASMLGITEIYKLGGAQAIFALANGTESIPKVDKIFGPGNAFVTAAKMEVSAHTAIDMPAGPSEVLVIADSTSNPAFVAADLLSQAEHGTDSQVVLLCTDSTKRDKILAETEKQLAELPRKEIAAEALKKSFAIDVPDLAAAFAFSNEYAPEHLILSFDSFADYLGDIENAGSVFCGKYTPESFGDYASGTNHTLPTSGFAKSFSGVSVESFGKYITFQEATEKGLQNLGGKVELMAEHEELFAHKNAVTIRKKNT
ncbi:MAG: histidinol dehydrogenase [Alphaproteobacteria bacterium]